MLMDLSVSRKYRIAFLIRFFMKSIPSSLSPFPTPCFPDGEGKGETIEPALGVGVRQREGVETASWLGQEAPSRLGQRQALGESCLKQSFGPGQGLGPGDSAEASLQGGFGGASLPDPDDVEPRPGPGRPRVGEERLGCTQSLLLVILVSFTTLQ